MPPNSNTNRTDIFAYNHPYIYIQRSGFDCRCGLFSPTTQSKSLACGSSTSICHWQRYLAHQITPQAALSWQYRQQTNGGGEALNLPSSRTHAVATASIWVVTLGENGPTPYQATPYLVRRPFRSGISERFFSLFSPAPGNARQGAEKKREKSPFDVRASVNALCCARPHTARKS